MFGLTGGTGTSKGLSIPLFVFAVGGSTTPLPFWLPAGGLQQYDIGVPAPIFQDDLIVRGGTVNVILAVDAAITDIVGCRMWWIATVDSPNLTILPGTALPWGFDPSTIADFSLLVGKVFHKSEAMLGPDNHVVSFEMKVSPRKVDQARYEAGGRQIALYLEVVNFTTTNDVALSVTFSHNMSFSGDANGFPGALVTANARLRTQNAIMPGNVAPTVFPSTPDRMDTSTLSNKRRT